MAAPRARYACDPEASRGRQYAEPASRTRSAFRRDCDRVIHSTAFRRLKHKTQVFVFHEGDHYRTRLTHSLEVAQIARALARQLGLDEDLTETLALAHDVGHPPFGHAGERALDRCLADHGGFDHNAQALRVVTALEHRYPVFDGLNLAWETLEGIVKHNGPLRGGGRAVGPVIAEFDAAFDLDLASYASLEAQAAAIADDIAYNAHDIDDGLRAGLFTLDELAAIPLCRDIVEATRRRYPGLDENRQSAELVRGLISLLIAAVIAETERRIAVAQPASAEAVRRCGSALVAFAPAVAEAEAAIKAFLRARMYRHPRVVRIMDDAEQIVSELFRRYMQEPAALPAERSAQACESAASETERARLVCDFMAGMTDRFAIDEHRRLFDLTPELR